MDPVKEGTGRAIVPRRRRARRELLLQSHQNGLLRKILPSHLRPPPSGIKRIVIVTVPVNIVGVQLLSTLIVLYLEVPATSRPRVGLAGGLVDGDDLWVDELSVDHVFVGTALEGVEGHDPVTDDDRHQVDRCTLVALVPKIDLHSEVGNVLPGVRLASDEETTPLVLRELLEEIDDSLKSVIGGVEVIVLVLLVQVVRVPHSRRRLQEEEVRYLVPRVFVLRQIIAQFVVDPVLQVIRPDLLNEPYIIPSLPSKEEHPGPPFNHKVTGSLFPAPLADSTKT